MNARTLPIPSHARRAFTLVEILIVVVILGILAALVIPQFANASDDARVSNMRNQLQTMKGCVELYRIQHRDVAPSLLSNGWDVVTSKTTTDGLIDPAGKWGPYLPSAPVNAITKSSAIVPMGTAPATTTGWYYDESTGEFQGADRTGAMTRGY